MAEDFQALNLNSKLISNTSLMGQPSDFIQGVKFDSQTDRNSVSKNKIRNFSFSQGSGGTIVLGGTSNGNGLLGVKDSSGGTVVTLDNNGLTITNGSINIQSSSGSTIIDSHGLNSLNNFQIGQVFNGVIANGTTTSLTPVDVPGGNFGTIVVTGRSVNMLFLLMGNGYNTNFITSDTNDTGVLNLFDSFSSSSITNVVFGGLAATDVTFPGGLINVVNSMTDQMVSKDSILKIVPGTHALKLQFAAVGGGTAVLDGSLVGVVVLGV